MGQMCFGCFKSWRTKCCFLLLMVVIVESNIYGSALSKTEFKEDYVDVDSQQKIKNAVQIVSDRTSLRDDRYTYSYSYDDEDWNSLQRIPAIERHTKHPVFVKKFLVPIKVHESQPYSKGMVLIIMLAMKALLIVMLSLGLPALVGLYLLILVKMITGLKTITSSNAFTLGVLSTKYLQSKQDTRWNLQQAASLLPFYAPLLLSSILSSASWIAGAAGLIGSLFSNSTNTNSTSTTTTTARTTSIPTQGFKRIEVLHLPSVDPECSTKKRKNCKVLNHHLPTPPQGRSSNNDAIRTTLEDFWKRLSTKFKFNYE